jgi:hypothetical protein
MVGFYMYVAVGAVLACGLEVSSSTNCIPTLERRIRKRMVAAVDNLNQSIY